MQELWEFRLDFLQQTSTGRDNKILPLGRSHAHAFAQRATAFGQDSLAVAPDWSVDSPQVIVIKLSLSPKYLILRILRESPNPSTEHFESKLRCPFDHEISAVLSSYVDRHRCV